MNSYQKEIRWRTVLLFSAVIIVGVSLWYSNRLANKLALEERNKMEMLAITYQHISEAGDNTDIGFLLHMVSENKNIPIILTDDKMEIIDSKNFDSVKIAKQPKYLEKELAAMRDVNDSIPIMFNGKPLNYIFYKDSYLLTQLKYFPYIQLLIIIIFLVVSYFAFFSSQRSIQNQLWVGMAKETAHQLATPISSLNACVEQIKMYAAADNRLEKMVPELDNDIHRLETITNRFGKIGSQPKLTPEDMGQVIKNSMDYMQPRTGKRVLFQLQNKLTENTMVNINAALFDWVIENLFKNAVDSMQGEGTITVSLNKSSRYVIIDIADTGKGIPSNLFKTIFKPGFSTKKRGWGLGLSLCKRIVEEYHGGKIFVKESQQNSGTTFRILIRK